MGSAIGCDTCTLLTGTTKETDPLVFERVTGMRSLDWIDQGWEGTEELLSRVTVSEGPTDVATRLRQIGYHEVRK